MTYHGDRVVGGDSMRRQIENGTLLTTQAAAGIFGVEPVTIRQWARRYRYLKPILRRPRILYRRADLERAADDAKQRHADTLFRPGC